MLGQYLGLTSSSENFQPPKYGKVSPLGSQYAVCLEGTRVRILQEIEKWSREEESTHPIYLLGDVAGSGKSTIANHLARKWATERRLAARFFFSRGTALTSNASDLCESFAMQLQSISEELRTVISAELVNRELLSLLPFTEQWKRLVIRPLKVLEGDNQLIVIDAVDDARRRQGTNFSIAY
jgi:hypothetical protein